MYLTYILPQTWSPKPLGVQGVYMDFATTVHPLPTLRRALALYMDPPPPNYIQRCATGTHRTHPPCCSSCPTLHSASASCSPSPGAVQMRGGGPHATRPTLTRTVHEWGTRMACSGPTPCGLCGTWLCCSGACESLRMCVHLVPLL